MVQIPTRSRTLSFSVREARTRPLDSFARGDEPDAKRARQSYAPIRVPRTATPLAPKSVNLTVTAVPFPTDAEETADDTQWGTSTLPSSSSSSSSSVPRQKRLVARTVSAPSKPAPVTPPPPPPAACTTRPLQPARARRPSPLAPYWIPPPTNENTIAPTRSRRGRLQPEPLARRALKAHFASTPRGAAVVKLGARRAIAQAECVAAVERVMKLTNEARRIVAGMSSLSSSSSSCPGVVSRAQLLPPVVMVGPELCSSRVVGRPSSSYVPLSRLRSPSPNAVRFPTSTRADADDGWVPLSVQPAPMEVEVEECDIVEMDTDGWCRS